MHATNTIPTNTIPTPPAKSRPRRFAQSHSLLVPIVLLCSAVVYLVALPLLRLQVPQPEIQAQQSRDHLERIGLALRSYHDKYDSLPPAYVSDSQGNRLYSWRVLILPFLGEDALFAAFDKNKAWNSPENLPLSKRLPEIFQLPGNVSQGCGYYAVTGSGTAFERDTAIHLDDVVDGASLTIGVVEIRGLTRSWAEPFDLDLDECPRVMGGRVGQLPGPDLNLTFQAAMLDGTVPSFWYPPEKCFRAMATIAGGEKLDPIEAQMLGQPRREPTLALDSTKQRLWE